MGIRLDWLYQEILMSFLFPKSFPFCVPPEAETEDVPTGSGTYYPFEMELEDVMALYWKSRTIECVASFSPEYSTENVTLGGTLNIDQQMTSVENTLYKWPEKMSEMICNPDQSPWSVFNKFIVGGSAYASVDGYPQNPDSPQAGVSVFLFSPNYYYRVITKNGKYFPRIECGIFIDARDMPLFENSAMSAVNIPFQSTYITKQNSFQININNNQYSTDLFAQLNIGGQEVLLNSSDVSLVLTANNDRLAE